MRRCHFVVAAACVACSGATTNSDSGVTDVLAARLKPTLQAMAELGVLLLVHGEVRGVGGKGCRAGGGSVGVAAAGGTRTVGQH